MYKLYFEHKMVIVAVLMIFISTATPFVLGNKVLRVVDGDTIVISSFHWFGPNTIHVRLADIDAPEKAQKFGKESTEVLSNKILHKRISVVGNKKDRYQRLIGKIYFWNRYINKEMVSEGYAWHEKKYSQSKRNQVEVKLMEDAETNARKNKLGLWKQLHPIPPWEFRKN